MKHVVYIVLVLMAVFNFNGCSAKSEITKVSESKSHFDGAVYEGQDFYVSDETTNEEKYRIFHQASTGFSGTSGIRKTAETRAKKFCQNLGKNKVMLKLSEHTAKPPYILGNFPRIEIIFACVDKQQTNNLNKYEQLAKIKSLLDNGVLTQKEFEIEKKKILN